jgi:hypothetical protein
MATDMKTLHENPVLHVRYFQDPTNEAWTATVDEEPAIVTQGNSLATTYERVRDALSLVRSDAKVVTLRGETFWDDRPDLDELPSQSRNLIKYEADLRLRLLELQDELQQTTLEGVRQLVGAQHRPYRDVGQLLGITFQRVEQICKQLGIVASSKQKSDRMVRG